MSRMLLIMGCKIYDPGGRFHAWYIHVHLGLALAQMQGSREITGAGRLVLHIMIILCTSTSSRRRISGELLTFSSSGR